MSKFDFKTQREISILASFLSAIDEEVISEKDLLSIMKVTYGMFQTLFSSRGF
ncbi:hypothetical protein [Serratia fonticola]|uniref:hypothetical protein n=1 Tax=Serratia fonticola TaxID=47917 RepID=UPI0021AE2727|nr:hypothetical protein [Serratia fonticola]